MRLNELERAILAANWAARCNSPSNTQIKVGEFFGTDDFVAVTQAHIMGIRGAAFGDIPILSGFAGDITGQVSRLATGASIPRGERSRFYSSAPFGG